MRKGKDYIVILSIILIFMFGSNIDNIFIKKMDIKYKDIVLNYESMLKRNYDELKKSNGLKIKDELNLNLTKVKLQNLYKLKEEITIYKGFKDKVEVGSAVLTDEGLVGVVKDTYAHESIVELITSPKSQISVKINDALGILKMQGGKLVVSDLSNYVNIQVGDKIYTSGSGLLPGNILVGTAKKIELNSSQIEKIISVELGQDLNDLNFLFIYGDSDD